MNLTGWAGAGTRRLPTLRERLKESKSRCRGTKLVARPAYGCARRTTVCPIRHKIALLISKENFDDTRSAQFQRPPTSISRFSTCATLERLSASRQFATTEVQHGDGVSRAVAG